MQKNLSQYPKKSLRPHSPLRQQSLPLLLVLLLHGTFAKADDNDAIAFTAGAGLNHDNNLFRTASDPQSDTIRRLFAEMKLKTAVSLQNFVVDANINDNHYQRFSDLDFYGANANGTWKWAIGDHTSGNLGYRYERFISDFGDIRTRTRNIITRKTPFFDLNYALTPEWQLTGQTSRAETDQSDPTRNSLDSRINSGSLGVNYWTGADNKLGLVVRRSNAEYPNQETVSVLNGAGNILGTITRASNSYRETEKAAVATWNISGVSTINARVGYTSRDHKEIPARNFSGGTGEVTYHWTPTASTFLDLKAYRQIQSSDDLSASYILFRGIAIAPVWKPTPLMAVKLRAVREMRDYNGDPGFALGASPRRTDSFRSAQISTTYAPTQRTELSIAFETGKRNSNLDSFDYKYNFTSAQFKVAI